MDYDDSKIDDDLDKLLQHIKEDQQNSMDAPDSPKEDALTGHGVHESLDSKMPSSHSRHLLYTTHFPLSQVIFLDIFFKMISANKLCQSLIITIFFNIISLLKSFKNFINILLFYVKFVFNLLIYIYRTRRAVNTIATNDMYYYMALDVSETRLDM